jgi:peptidyl-tRNA hydrolase, PTH1 family
MTTSTEETKRSLVVGLGNPGAKYQKTRHNIGFECLEELSNRLGNPLPLAKFEGQMVRGKLVGIDTILLWPLTYMNESGRSVAQLVGFYKIPPERILVVCDDMSLPLGKLRIRARGSSGGQKGLADILKSLGTEDVPRLRIGIDRPPPEWEVTDFVLSRFREHERATMSQAIKRAADAVQCWLTDGILTSMNEYNRE